MLGPLSLLNNGSIANANLLLNPIVSAKDVVGKQYSLLNNGGNLLINHANRQSAGQSKAGDRTTSSRRQSDDISMLTAERYADLEWPVKRALTFGYTNYANRNELTNLNKKETDLDSSSLQDNLETKEQLAKYYFKLFPFTANNYKSSFLNSSNDIFNTFYSNDKLDLDVNNKNRKTRPKINSRKLTRKQKGANTSSSSSSRNEQHTKQQQLNANNFKTPYLNRQSSIESSSSSSSSRRSSTDTIENNTSTLSKNGDKLIEDEEILKKKKGLSFSSNSNLELLLNRQDEAEDEELIDEKELNDDEDFNLLEELNEESVDKLVKRKNDNFNQTISNDEQIVKSSNALVDRDLNDKQLLNSLMQNSVQIDNKLHRLDKLNKLEKLDNLDNQNEPTDNTSSNNSNNNNSLNVNNSIASLSKNLSKLSNSSLESPFYKLNTSNHLHSPNLNQNNLDLQAHVDNELADDSEDDDDLEQQFITTMSIIKKSRNVRHSKPLNKFNEQAKGLKKDSKDDDFSLTSADDLPANYNENNNQQPIKSKKKRREMNFIETSEMLPEPAALQSSSLSNQWINSTSSPSFNSPTTSSNIQSSNSSSLNDNTIDRPTLTEARSWKTILFLTLKIIAICTVILLAIFGNLLVIISVLRHHKLRITTNYFVVSLACADILVALFAMTFKASLAIHGSWLFGQLVCDLWNSCDVLFSTASIMHLCCISVDRYYAIIKPLDYPMKITNKLVFIMLTVVWISSTIISFIPIFTGIYTTNEVLDYQKQHPDECDFHVNPYYALISSTVSFWIPCIVMLFTYYRIYLEATRQEKALYKTQMIIPQHHHRNKKKQQKSQTNVQSIQPPQSNQQQTNQLNVNNNNNQVNLNDKNKEDANAQNSGKNSILDIDADADVNVDANDKNASATNAHNGARLSNTSTTTTVTTLSTSTTTTATTSGPATTSSSTGAQQSNNAQTDSSNSNNNSNNKEETSLTRRKSSLTTSSTPIPNSQSMELKNSQINLSIQKEHPKPPTSIDIQPANTAPISSAHRNSHGDDTESGQSTPTKRNINKMRREHKAAKTLGIIMGAFFICWLPFFTVYVMLAICGSSCDSFPGVVVDFLFWIGYFNSSLNPIIYAYFNREFREAFKKTIQDVFCCCLYKVECISNIRYQLAGQSNPDRLMNNGLGPASGPNYARRNTTASYTGQFSTTSGALGPTGNNNQLLSNSNLSMNSSTIKPPISNSSATK